MLTTLLVNLEYNRMQRTECNRKQCIEYNYEQ